MSILYFLNDCISSTKRFFTNSNHYEGEVQKNGAVWIFVESMNYSGCSKFVYSAML